MNDKELVEYRRLSGLAPLVEAAPQAKTLCAPIADLLGAYAKRLFEKVAVENASSGSRITCTMLKDPRWDGSVWVYFTATGFLVSSMQRMSRDTVALMSSNDVREWLLHSPEELWDEILRRLAGHYRLG